MFQASGGGSKNDMCMAMDSLDVSRQEPGWFFRELGTKKFAADGIKAGKTFVQG